MFLRAFLLSLVVSALAAPTAAHATEVHAVGVYEGNIRTNGQIHGGQVRVLVDRKEANIVLSLSSYEPVRWFVETVPGTRIDGFYLHGYRPEKSEVYLNGIPVTPKILTELSYAYENRGSKFRQMVKVVTEKAGVDRLASFHGAYQAPEAPFVVDRIVVTPENKVEHLQDLVRADLVVPELRPYLDPDYRNEGPQVDFTYDGFVLNVDDDRQVFPPTLDVPDISHPVGGAHDPESSRLFGVTRGGEGFIYQLDMNSNQWSIIASMENADASGMFYDSAKDRLIFMLQHGRSSMMTFNLKEKAAQHLSIEIEVLPGFSDLYDPGNGPMAPMTPIAVSGDWLLARANVDHRFARNEGKGASRTYVINLTSGETALVAYQNVN